MMRRALDRPIPRPLSGGRASSRRAFLQATAAVGISVAGVGLVGTPVADARPGRSRSTITLSFWIDWQGLPAAAPQISAIMAEVMSPFEGAHPGVRVATGAGQCAVLGPNMSAPNTVSQIISGIDVDVFSSCSPTFSDFVRQGLVLGLNAFLQQDNVPLTTWPAATLESYRFGPELYFLPSEVEPRVLIYNKSVLDQLGLRMPTPDWTYTEAAQLWRSCSGGKVNGKQRLGAMLPVPHNSQNWPYIAAGWGGSYQNATFTRANFSSSEVVAGARWMVEGLVWDKVVSRGSVFRHAADLASGRVVFQDAPSWSLPVIADSLRTTDWQFIPYPIWPVRRATMDLGDCLGIAATTRYPDLAWELLKYVTADPTFWRRYVRVSLGAPAAAALWPEWEAVIHTVAPDLRGRGLEYYTAAVLQNYGVAGHPWAYENAQCDSIIDHWSELAISRKMSVTEACARIDQDLNALLATAGQVEAALQAKTQQVQAQLQAAERAPRSARFPVPQRGGVGAAPTPAAALVRADAGSVAVRGGGSGFAANGDGGAFFATADTAADATLSCRLSYLGGIGASAPKAGMAGLMVRGDLSGDAPMAAVVVTLGQGLAVNYRQTLVASVQTNAPPSATTATGLIGAGRILLQSARPASNILSTPVWLKLVRDLATWTVYSSLDGTTWTPAGSPVTLQMAGAWVGLFVSADSPIAPQQPAIEARFDHLSGFTPNTPVQWRGV